MNLHISVQMDYLKEYQGKDLNKAVEAANAMWKYYTHVKSHVTHLRLEDKLNRFSDKELAVYLIWDGRSKAAPTSLASQLATLVYACSVQQSKGESKGPNSKVSTISIAELTNVLNQLKDLQGGPNLHPTLKKCIDYNFWSQRVTYLFNDMFNYIETAAEKSDTFQGALDVLKFARTNFSVNFMGHIQGGGFSLESRITRVKAALEEYNKDRSSAFETEEGCKRLNTRLNHLKKKHGYSHAYYVFDWVSRARTTSVCNEY
jgi:hypothetical protein